MVMGKGGVGKTTVAVRGRSAPRSTRAKVHLSTTDPAGDLPPTLIAEPPPD